MPTSMNAIGANSVGTTPGQALVAAVGGGYYNLATIPGVNRVINGDFQIWQRGAGGAAAFTAVLSGTTLYTADRWQFQIAGGGGTSGACSQVAGPTSGSYLAKVQRTAANAGVDNITFITSLTRDMCLGAAGNVVTISFKAKAGANFSAATMAVAVFAGTGTADVSSLTTGFTGQTTAITQNVTLTGGLTNYIYTSPAILGATVTQLAAQFQFIPVGTAGADDSFYITDVQIDISPQQTPFQRKSFGVALQECERFYRKTFLYGTAPAQNIGAGAGEYTYMANKIGALLETSPNILFPQNMLKTPTVVTYSPSAATAQIYDESATAACTLTTQINVNAKGFGIYATGNASTAVGNVLGVHYTADADVT